VLIDSAIVPFFPHQVSDLEVVVKFIERYRIHRNNIDNNWVVPYLMLLWLSLICRLPFDLANFDDAGFPNGSTAQKIEQIGQTHLDKAGIDRDSAALLLSRFYTR
jgi:tubulin-specific chaperone D